MGVPLAIAALILTGCSSPGASPSPSSSSTGAGSLKSEVPTQYRSGITVAAQADIAPLNFTDSAGNETGLDYDLLNAISAELGVKITIEPVTFENLILGLDSGKYDFVADTTVTSVREKTYDMVSYLNSSYSTATLKSAKDLGSKATGLCGVKTGIVTGEVSATYITQTIDPACSKAGLSQVNTTEYKDFATTMLAVEGQTIDAALVDTGTFGYFLKSANGKDLKYNGPGQIDLSPAGYSFLKTKNAKLAPVVQQALKKLIASGEYGKIFAKYGQSAAGVEKTGPVLNPTVG